MKNEKRCAVILAAGGSGTRFGGEKNKILLSWGNHPIIWYSLNIFLHHPAVKELALVCREADEAEMDRIVQEFEGESLPLVRIVRGGASRRESVLNGLLAVTEEKVLVHDAARPFFPADAVDRCLDALESCDAVTLGIPSRDTVKLVTEDGYVLETINRSAVRLIQTPQGFDRSRLLIAHQACPRTDITDDCGLMEWSGCDVRVIEGSVRNIKITTPEDLPT